MVGSFLFLVAGYLVTFVMAIFYIPLLLAPKSIVHKCVRFWVRILHYLQRLFLKIHYRIIADQPIPDGCIIACKHQSAWETLFFPVLSPGSAIVAKKTLSYFPITGQLMKRSGAIMLDRSKPAQSIRQLISKGKEALAQGQNIFIFPEGTRSDAGAKGVYHPGISALYSSLKVPVVPVALNSGWFWPRRKFCKYPGTITVRVLEPIQPGLDKKTFMQELENRIESACVTLNEDAKKQLEGVCDQSI